LPRLRGRAGVGAASDRRAQRSRVGHCPHPNLPPQAGEGAGSRREGTGHAPSPACGGGPGWGPLQIAALNGLASDIAPIPTFPRTRGRGPVHGEKVPAPPPPPLAGGGGGGGRFRSPRSTVSRRTLPPSRPSPASGGRGRFTARRFRPRPLPPLAGEGRGGGRFRSPRSTVSHRTSPPSQPSPASGGRSWGVEAS